MVFSPDDGQKDARNMYTAVGIASTALGVISTAVWITHITVELTFTAVGMCTTVGITCTAVGITCTAVGIMCIDNVEEISFTHFVLVISNVEEYYRLERNAAPTFRKNMLPAINVP